MALNHDISLGKPEKVSISTPEYYSSEIIYASLYSLKICSRSNAHLSVIYPSLFHTAKRRLFAQHTISFVHKHIWRRETKFCQKCHEIITNW